ncbi:Arf GTPase-activating protein [Entamoeba marina]
MSSHDVSSFFKNELLLPDNNKCFDCGKSRPQWVSLNNGVYLCFQCVGRHYHYGIHISRLMSIYMDNFRLDELMIMSLGGNKRAREYFEQNPPTPNTDKYTSESGKAYRQLLQQKVYDKTGLSYKNGR